MTLEQRESYLNDLALSNNPELKGSYVYDPEEARDEADEINKLREEIFGGNNQSENISQEEDRTALQTTIDFYKERSPELATKDKESIRRVYAAFRRSGLSPEEAQERTISKDDVAERSKIIEVLGTHTHGVERVRKNRNLTRKELQ